MSRYVELVELPLRLTAEGIILHGEEPVHPKVLQLFLRHIVVDAQQQFYIELGREKAPLLVEDTAYFVLQTWVECSCLILRLSDQKIEPLQPDTLVVGHNDVLYCSIHRHAKQVWARFTRSAYHQLLPLLSVHPQHAQQYVLQLGEQHWTIGQKPV